jgi:hypothetical protein
MNLVSDIAICVSIYTGNTVFDGLDLLTDLLFGGLDLHRVLTDLFVRWISRFWFLILAILGRPRVRSASRRVVVQW